MFYILFGSSWLIEERINGTLKRLVSMHNGLEVTFLANILALFIGGIAQIAVFAGLQKIFFNIDLFTHVWLFIIICFYLLAVISITFLLSSILNTPARLQAGAPVFALLTSFMGGCFWNFVDISNQMKLVSMFTIQGIALYGINNILINNISQNTLIVPILLLLGVIIILLSVSFLIVNKRIQSS